MQINYSLSRIHKTRQELLKSCCLKIILLSSLPPWEGELALYHLWNTCDYIELKLNVFLNPESSPDIKTPLGITQLAGRICCRLLYCSFHPRSIRKVKIIPIYFQMQSPFEWKLSKDLDKSHLRFQHSKSHPNASTWTLTKTQEGVPEIIVRVDNGCMKKEAYVN